MSTLGRRHLPVKENALARYQLEQPPSKVRDAIITEAGPIEPAEHVVAGFVGDFQQTTVV